MHTKASTPQSHTLNSLDILLLEAGLGAEGMKQEGSRAEGRGSACQGSPWPRTLLAWPQTPGVAPLYRFHHLQNGDISHTYCRGLLCLLNTLMPIKHFESGWHMANTQWALAIIIIIICILSLMYQAHILLWRRKKKEKQGRIAKCSEACLRGGWMDGWTDRWMDR